MKLLCYFLIVFVNFNLLFAQKLEDVCSCDNLAAHPYDKNKWAEGVEDARLVPMPAMKACVQAVTRYPDSPRFHFQLGRALWAGQRYDAAATAFISAIDRGHVAANYYLGLAYEKGVLTDEAVDLEAARGFYALAADDGFVPATEALDHLKKLVMDFNQFAMADMMKAFHTNGAQDWARKPLWPLVYIGSMNNALNEPGMLYLLEQGKQRGYLREMIPALSTEAAHKLATNQTAVNQTTRMGWGMMGGFLKGMAEARKNGASISEELAAANRGAMGGSGGGFMNIEMVKNNAARDARLMVYLYEDRPEDFRKIYRGMVRYVREVVR